MTTEPTQVLFKDFSLSPQLAKAIQELSYTEPTTIQAAAIPLLLQGMDVIGRSSTGTGKTAAFGIPAVECIDSEMKRPQVLVLSPTRELAMQIAREMQKYAKYKDGISVAAVYGGASMTDQIRALKRANIVIGTPGRIMDHLRRRTLKTDQIKMVVLDEADEMLSMGFVEDIQTILSDIPQPRQTVLFSATMPPPILKISEEFLTEPQMVDVMPREQTGTTIEQTFYYVPQSQKQQALSILLQHTNPQRGIIFCNTKSMVDELAEKLSSQGFRATGLHGDMSQAVRTQVMHGFRNGRTNILIATDVAARGIDVDDVDAVVNFDIPQSFEYYIHRIGRTGRAGKAGVSQTLVSNGSQLSTLKALMRFTGTTIVEHPLPTPKQLLQNSIKDIAHQIEKDIDAKPGECAATLVEELLKNGHSSEAIMYALAEKLTSENAKLASLAAAEEIRAEKPRRAGRPGDASMVTVVASIGRNQRIVPNHLIGAIVEAVSPPAKSIGKIEIRDDVSYIGLREETAKDLLAHTKSIRIAGQKVKFTLQRKKQSSPSQRTRREKDRHFKSKRKI